jgi:hypothetical protein
MTSQPYFIDEGSVQLPAGFQDRSTNIFIQGDPAGSSLNFNIARDQLRPDESLQQYVTRQIDLMQNNMTSYKLKSRDPAQLGAGAIEGEQIDATSKSSGKTIYQRQAAFPLHGTHVLIFSAISTTMPGEKFARLWQDWLGSFVPREPVDATAGEPDSKD